MNKGPPRRFLGVLTCVLALLATALILGLFGSTSFGTTATATAGPVSTDTAAIAPTDSAALLSAPIADSAVLPISTGIDVTTIAGTGSEPVLADASGGSGGNAILSDVLIIDLTTSQATAFVAAMAIFAAVLLGAAFLFIRRITQHRGQRLSSLVARSATIDAGEEKDRSVTSRTTGIKQGRVALNSGLLFDVFFGRLRGTGSKWASATLAPY